MKQEKLEVLQQNEDAKKKVKIFIYAMLLCKQITQDSYHQQEPRILSQSKSPSSSSLNRADRSVMRKMFRERESERAGLTMKGREGEGSGEM